MSTKTSRQERASWLSRRGRHIVIAAVVLLSLFAGWTLLAYSGALDSMLKQKKKAGGEMSIQSFNSDSASKEYIYAGGRLVATEEPAGSSGCGSPPPSPSNSLVATAQSTTSVLLNWAASAGADHYEVQRKETISSAWVTLSPNPSTNSFTDNGLVAGTTYLYQVRAVDATGACPSGYSNVDLATTVIFTDDPLLSRLTIIKAQHVSEVRQAVDAVRATADMGSAIWTNPLNQVSAIHFSELRDRLNEALPVLGFSTIPADPGIAPTGITYETHLQAVRDKVK